MKRKLKSFVKKIVDAYQINDGMVHIECFVSQKTILLGELTIRPPGGYLMNLIEAVYGFDPWRALLDVSLGNKPHCPQKNRCVAAVYIAHPGEGTIDSIEGYEKIMQLPEFYFGKIKKMAGDIVRKREGSGQDIGYILFVAKNYLAIAKVIEKAKKLLAITLKSSS